MLLQIRNDVASSRSIENPKRHSRSRYELTRIGQPLIEILRGPADSSITERRRVLVSRRRAGHAAENPAEHGADLVGVERMTRGTPFTEELLPARRVRFGCGDEPGQILGIARIRGPKEGV